jgi:hypothetical protein
MKVTIKLSDEKAAALEAEAHSKGLTLEKWILQLAEQHAQPNSIANQPTTNLQGTNEPNPPILSIEATSRESICPDGT